MWVAAVVVLVLATGFSCTRDKGCRGADSPEDAVRQLFEAADDTDVGAATCVVTEKTSPEQVRTGLDEIRAFVVEAGGQDNLTIAQVPSRQMGSHIVVEVTVTGTATTVELDVFQSGGKYRVGLAQPAMSDEDTDEESSNPYPDDSPKAESET